MTPRAILKQRLAMSRAVIRTLSAQLRHERQRFALLKREIERLEKGGPK